MAYSNHACDLMMRQCSCIENADPPKNYFRFFYDVYMIKFLSDLSTSNNAHINPREWIKPVPVLLVVCLILRDRCQNLR